MGQTGVGKSTLLNTWLRVELETGEISDSLWTRPPWRTVSFYDLNGAIADALASLSLDYRRIDNARRISVMLFQMYRQGRPGFEVPYLYPTHMNHPVPSSPLLRRKGCERESFLPLWITTHSFWARSKIRRETYKKYRKITQIRAWRIWKQTN